MSHFARSTYKMMPELNQFLVFVARVDCLQTLRWGIVTLENHEVDDNVHPTENKRRTGWWEFLAQVPSLLPGGLGNIPSIVAFILIKTCSKSEISSRRYRLTSLLIVDIWCQMMCVLDINRWARFTSMPVPLNRTPWDDSHDIRWRACNLPLYFTPLGDSLMAISRAFDLPPLPHCWWFSHYQIGEWDCHLISHHYMLLI